MSKIYITEQTFRDLSTWLVSPNEYSKEQLTRLIDEELCLPLIALANQYWLIGFLTSTLQGSSVWSLLPLQLKEYLVDMSGFYANRSDMLKTEAIDVCKLLAEADIDVILMKGVASLFNGSAVPISKRYMNDIDLLVREEQLEYAYEVLEKSGFKKDNDFFDYKYSHHAPPLLRNNVCYIELHRWLLEKHINKVLPPGEAWERAKPITLNNKLTLKQLSPTHQVILCIAHSEIQNGGYDQCRIDLHQLMNLQSIVCHYKKEIDWALVKEHFKKTGQEVVLQAMLYVAFELVEIKTPITDYNNLGSKNHFNKCITRFVKRQGKDRVFSVIMEQLYLYKGRNIKLRCDHKTYFWYFKGAYQQLKSHLRKLFNKHHVQLFITRLKSY